MLRNCLRIGFRNLSKYKGYSILTVVGLSIGLTCGMLMFLFVREELSYDRFHTKPDRIYRVVRAVRSVDGGTSYTPLTSGPLADAMRRDFPEVEAATRSWMWTVWVRHGEQWFSEGAAFVDSNFLSVLDFPLVQGNRLTALQEPYSIVITEQMAQRYFGETDPLGKIITIDRESLSGDYSVTGVVRLPENSSLKFDFLLSTAPQVIREHLEAWQDRQFFSTYVLLSENASAETLEQKLPDFIAQYKGDTWREDNRYHLQPLTRVHLYSNADYPGIESWRGDNITALYLVSLTSLFILIIACVNFINLATAQSAVRMREVGIRKVVGARRHQLIGQFLGESLVMTVLALVLSVALVEVLLPMFNGLTGKRLVLLVDMDVTLISGMIGIALGVGLLSGLYPAFAISRLQPLLVLKGGTAAPLKGRRFRGGLVVFQFSLSILLIICTGVVYRQLDFIHRHDPGFDASSVVILPIFRADRTLQKASDNRLSLRYNQVKQAFLSASEVFEATASRPREPGDGGGKQKVRVEGMLSDLDMRVQIVDEDFLDVYKIPLISGQDFSLEMKDGLILNQTAMRRLGWTDAVGKSLIVNGHSRTVIGVAKDYHSASLYQAIEPVVLYMHPPDYLHLSLKVDSKNLPETLAFLKRTWSNWIPNRPFRFYFAEDFINRAYQDDRQFGRVAGIASLLAIFVACLGLLGLASFMTTRRTKEIGIRKVLGATTPNIVAILFRELLKPLALANVIAWPVAFWITRRWLEHFVYRTDLSVWVFVWCSLLVCLVAAATVGYQAIKAAMANPVDALQYE